MIRDYGIDESPIETQMNTPSSRRLINDVLRQQHQVSAVLRKFQKLPIGRLATIDSKLALGVNFGVEYCKPQLQEWEIVSQSEEES
jgi:hypothetical protein